MKKICCVIIVLFIFMGLFGCASDRIYDSNFFETDNNICIEKSNVNNESNNNSANGMSADIVQLGDKLYINDFEDKGDSYRNTIIELTTHKTRYIYSENFKKEDQNISFLGLNNTLDNRILLSADSDTYLDTSNGKLIESNNSYSPGYGQYDSFTENNIRYFYNLERLYKYENNKYSLLIDAKKQGLEWLSFEPGTLYISKSDIFYQEYKNNKLFICRYNILGKTVTKKYEAVKKADRSTTVRNIICDGNKVFYIYDKYDKKAKLNRYYLSCLDLETSEVKIVYESPCYLIANVYDGIVYLSISGDSNKTSIGEKGLYKIEYKTNRKPEKIYDGEPDGIYIFDDTYINFVEYSDNDVMTVKRIKLTDNSIEEVFRGENNSDSTSDGVHL